MFGFTDEIREVIDHWEGIGSAPARANRRKPGVSVLSNPLLEKTIGTSHPALPGVWFLPPIVYGLYVGLRDPSVSVAATLGMFMAGVLAWTLLEYWLHRVLFHIVPKQKTLRFYWFMLHGYHHEFPNDRLRLVMPPIMSWPIAAGFYFIARAIGGPYWLTTLVGVYAGYLAYDWVHYYTHHARPKGRVGKFLRRFHLEHHYKDETTHFGLSSPLWDVVFGTFSRPSPPTDLESSLDV
jgi:sterol desaturase/sphingolipid hydroxylase (fatty acid hydroxylase superfamily)